MKRYQVSFKELLFCDISYRHLIAETYEEPRYSISTNLFISYI